MNGQEGGARSGQFSRTAHFSFGFINPNFYEDQPQANLLTNIEEDEEDEQTIKSNL